MLTRDKHSSLLQTFVNYGRKKSYSIEPRSFLLSIEKVFFLFYKASYLAEEVNRTKPSPSVKVPWTNPLSMLMVSATFTITAVIYFPSQSAVVRPSGLVVVSTNMLAYF